MKTHLPKKECCQKCVHTRPDPDRGRYQGWCKNGDCPCHASTPTSGEKWEELAETLYNQTMRDIDYGDSRNNPEWQKIVKEGFIAYAKETFSSLLSSRDKEWERERREILEALAFMWEQYCPPPFTHKYMTAGEATEVILQRYGILKANASIDWQAPSLLPRE